jgi:hypothetical protein
MPEIRMFETEDFLGLGLYAIKFYVKCVGLIWYAVIVTVIAVALIDSLKKF